MTELVLGAVIAGAAGAVGAGITLVGAWVQAHAHKWEVAEQLRHQTLENRKDRIAEVRKPYLTVLKQTMAELLQIDREGAISQRIFERLLSSDEPVLAKNAAAQEFIANNKRSDQVNGALRK